MDRAGGHKINKVYKNQEPVDKAGGDTIECASMLDSEFRLVWIRTEQSLVGYFHTVSISVFLLERYIGNVLRSWPPKP